MLTAGIREVKAHLSEFLKKVKNGERLRITDRGKEVAVVIPTANRSFSYKNMLKLIEKGVIPGAGGRLRGLNPPVKVKGKPLSQTVLEQRG